MKYWQKFHTYVKLMQEKFKTTFNSNLNNEFSISYFFLIFYTFSCIFKKFDPALMPTFSKTRNPRPGFIEKHLLLNRYWFCITQLTQSFPNSVLHYRKTHRRKVWKSLRIHSNIKKYLRFQFKHITYKWYTVTTNLNIKKYECLFHFN